MENKKDIQSRARDLIETSPEEAVVLYRKLWDEFAGEFNAWDGLFALKALRKTEKPDINWAFQVAERFQQDEKVSNVLGWLVFDKCVKGMTRERLLNNESHISHFAKVIPQKNLRENSTYPCPVTIAIFKLADAYTENQYNAAKVYEWVDKLNPNYLSKQSKSISTDERGEVELAPDIEKYYAHMTKALIELELYDKCESVCKKALSDLSLFHYDNEIWFKRHIAKCCKNLGRLEESEKYFKELLSTKAGSSKWFIYRDIAELYFGQKNYDKAWKYTVDASFYGNEPHYMIGLYLLQARILFALGRPEEGKVFAQLIASILKNQGWKNKAEYNNIFKYYHIDFESFTSTDNYSEIVKRFLASERYKNKPKILGKTISVHKNGKIGRIKDENGLVYEFHRKDFVEKLHKTLDKLVGATLEFIPMESFDGKLIAEHIKITQFPEIPQDTGLEGKILWGTVKGIKDYGVFVKFRECQDGLLHRNNLPTHLKEVFQNNFEIGREIQVKIVKVSSKGLELAML